MKTRLLAAVMLAVLTLSACGVGGADGDSGKGSDSRPEGAASTAGDVSLGSEEVDSLVKDSAAHVVTLWARPDIPFDQWAAELRPQLSSIGVSVLSFSDPSTLEAAEPEGDVRISAGSDTTARVVVPTNAGDYFVTMSRPDANSTWQVDRVIPPVS